MTFAHYDFDNVIPRLINGDVMDIGSENVWKMDRRDYPAQLHTRIMKEHYVITLRLHDRQGWRLVYLEVLCSGLLQPFPSPFTHVQYICYKGRVFAWHPLCLNPARFRPFKLLSHAKERTDMHKKIPRKTFLGPDQFFSQQNIGGSGDSVPRTKYGHVCQMTNPANECRMKGDETLSWHNAQREQGCH